MLKAAEVAKNWPALAIPKNGAIALTFCHSELSHVSSYILKMPVMQGAGVCYFLAEDVGRFFDARGKFLGLNHPRKDTFSLSSKRSLDLLAEAERVMRVGGKNCPRQGETGYSGTKAVSLGLFRSVLGAYKFMTATEANLLAMSGLRQHDEFEAKSLGDFRTMLKGRYGRAPTPYSVGLNEYLPTQPIYELNIAAPGGGHGWVLGMELEQGGWKLVKISSWIS